MNPLKDAINRSETPMSMAQEVKTTMSTEDCWCDPVAKQIQMTKEEQLAFRCKAFNAAKPNTDTSLAGVGYEAGEVED